MTSLHETMTCDHAARQDNPTLCLEQAGPNNHIGDARLVLDQITPVFVAGR
jgi:hypothetical protein